MSTSASNEYDVVVTTEDLDSRPSPVFPAGDYTATIQPGSSIATNDNGWRALRIPVAKFTSKDGTVIDRQRNAQFTWESSSEKAVEIGRRAVIGAARKLGLTEQTTSADGKEAHRLSVPFDELPAAIDALAGTEVNVYVKVVTRKRNKQPVLKEDGSPVLDNEIVRIS